MRKKNQWSGEVTLPTTYFSNEGVASLARAMALHRNSLNYVTFHTAPETSRIIRFDPQQPSQSDGYAGYYDEGEVVKALGQLHAVGTLRAEFLDENNSTVEFQCNEDAIGHHVHIWNQQEAFTAADLPGIVQLNGQRFGLAPITPGMPKANPVEQSATHRYDVVASETRWLRCTVEAVDENEVREMHAGGKLDLVEYDGPRTPPVIKSIQRTGYGKREEQTK